MKLRSTKGFTLIELVVVLIIIAILAMIAVPAYRNYVRRSMASEGKAVMGSVATAQKLYYTEHTAYYPVPSGTVSNLNGTENTNPLGVNTQANRYFRTYSVTSAAGNHSANTIAVAGDASGLQVNMAGTPTTTIAIEVFDGGNLQDGW
jgi:prepilin-type N-terminal cleavage/methylation domain-containing protein